MTEPITRHQDSERRGPIISPADASPTHPPTGRAQPAPNLLANLVRALPQPRLARPRSGSPPHPISAEGNQPS
jgi:hypothetical protein